ncbi:MAG: hypothetical protein RMK91_05410 [Pseudanabaenaceae cyanobacterium SKYGB_i_bin29]|nr:hypothetical protein [Pseudanabaenaceae cyanobacterium SKYG29]MDW8421286.1 hypothetical protein [Pseudanabaenaceae cyanobacterium SKYGB_i_bin29]
MLPNPRVIEAVEKLNYQVTIADVAAQTGLALGIVNREIANLASLTAGNLLVTETGEICYKFSPNLRNILLQRSLRARLQAFLKQVWGVLFYLIRISFGIVLIISIVLVVLAIFAAVIIISSSSASDREREDERRSGSSGGGIGFFPWYWLDFSPIFTPAPYSRSAPTPTRDEEIKDRGFLENVFAFLFGDGNPNFDLEERRYRLIANVIRNSDGVIVGEQVLPYLDELPAHMLESEDYILPILAKFNGYPEVTPTGSLVYRFPDLQKVASRRPKQSVPDYLEEKLWHFNYSGEGANLLSAGLGIFYLVASLVLGGLLQDPIVKRNLTGLLGFVNSIFVFLLGYAILFVTIPTVRFFWLQWLNQGIRYRNDLRRCRLQLLSQAQVKQKLQYAQTLAISQSAIDEQKLAYSTEQDLLPQELERLLSTPD